MFDFGQLEKVSILVAAETWDEDSLWCEERSAGAEWMTTIRAMVTEAETEALRWRQDHDSEDDFDGSYRIVIEINGFEIEEQHFA